MKRLFIYLAAAMIALSGCSTTKYYLASNYKLDSIESSAAEAPVLAAASTYSDDLIDISLDYGEKTIAIVLSNKSNGSLKVLWDDASYIDQFGSAHRVIHTGTKLVDRDKAQVPSVVPKNSKLTDEVIPSDCIEWVSGTKYTAGGWQSHPISQMFIYETEEAAKNASVDFKPVQLLLPIETNSERFEYTFKFVSDKTNISSFSEMDLTKTMLLTGAICGAALIVEVVALSNMN